MADVRISELPLANTPVDSTSVVPVVTGGSTKRASISQLGFLPAGSGASTRTIQDKLRDAVSVKDFGAVGNGVTNDVAAIQAAIDAVAAAGGGTVFLPEGTYATTSRIQPKSNVHIVGEGLGSRIVCSGSVAISATRDDAPNNTTPHTNIRLFNFYVESAWLGASPTHVDPCVELEFCDDCVIDSINVGKADDACIRISGYRKGIVSFTASLTNPDFGFAKRNAVRNCTVNDGYLGIELVGGAQCDIIGNIVRGSYYHGIRLAGGGWDCAVSENKVMTCTHTALYVEVVRNLAITDNPYLRSDRTPTKTGISFGAGENTVVSNNVVVGTVGDTVLTGVFDNLVVSSNVIDGDVNFSESTDTKVFGNYITGSARIEGTATGELYDNMVGSVAATAANMIQAGGATAYRNNHLISSKLPASPTVQASILGAASAPPSTGTFRAGDIILKAAASDYSGWICTTAGTPGTWRKFGLIEHDYSRTVFGYNDGTNQTRTLLTFTVPNASHAIRLTVNLFLSRSPGSGPGTSRVIRNEITVVRQAGSDCVIDTALATGNYEVATTTAGGATSPAASSLTATIASGTATDPQVINVTALFGTSLVYGVWQIDVMSTSVMSTYGL